MGAEAWEGFVGRKWFLGGLRRCLGVLEVGRGPWRAKVGRGGGLGRI